MPTDPHIPAEGLRFQSPISELEEILHEKIRRAQDAGEKETAALYREVLALSRKKVEMLGLDPGEESPGLPPG